nr:DUF397 domain-containing protein [Herbihabitans rhizosphaerae]
MDFTDAAWRKSTRSGNGTNGDCVEVALSTDAVGVRDSKNSTANPLAFSREAWRTFLTRP